MFGHGTVPRYLRRSPLYLTPQIGDDASARGEYANQVAAQQRELKRSRRSFMHWPIEWLWIAVIVALALLILVGLVMSEGSLRFQDSGKGSPTVRADT